MDWLQLLPCPGQPSAPHSGSTAAVPGRPAVPAEEKQGKPRLWQKPLEQLSKGAQRPGWVPLAGSWLGPGVPGASTEPGNPPAAPGFRPLCQEPVPGRWRGRGGAAAICVAPARAASPVGREAPPDGGRPCEVWPRGTGRPLPRSPAGREISDAAAFPEVGAGFRAGSAVWAHASFPAQPANLALGA